MNEKVDEVDDSWYDSPWHLISDDNVRVEYFKKKDGKRELHLFVQDKLVCSSFIDPNDYDKTYTDVKEGMT